MASQCPGELVSPPDLFPVVFGVFDVFVVCVDVGMIVAYRF